jgi:hypothetical protein
MLGEPTYQDDNHRVPLRFGKRPGSEWLQLLDEDYILEIVDKLGLREDKKWIAISAVTGKNMKELKKLIAKIFQNNM